MGEKRVDLSSKKGSHHIDVCGEPRSGSERKSERAPLPEGKASLYRKGAHNPSGRRNNLLRERERKGKN